MRTLAVLSILLTFSWVEMSRATEGLIIGFVADKSERSYRIGDRLLQEISKKMQIKITLISLPGKRAVVLLREGKIHADLSRIAAFQKRVPEAIRIEEFLASTPYYVYSSLAESFPVDDWDSLKPYKIVTVRGLVFIDQYLSEHHTHKVGSMKAAFGFIKNKRADLYIENVLAASAFLQSDDFDSEGITRLEPAIAILKSYTFFSARYPNFAKKYQQALEAIKEEGIYQDVFRETK